MAEEPHHAEPEGSSPEANPYAPPQEPGGSVIDRKRRRRRILLVVAGVFLVPIASIICFYCCCLAGFASAPSYRSVNIQFAFVFGFFGAIAGAALTIFLLVKLWKRT